MKSGNVAYRDWFHAITAWAEDLGQFYELAPICQLLIYQRYVSECWFYIEIGKKKIALFNTAELSHTCYIP